MCMCRLFACKRLLHYVYAALILVVEAVPPKIDTIECGCAVHLSHDIRYYTCLYDPRYASTTTVNRPSITSP